MSEIEGIVSDVLEENQSEVVKYQLGNDASKSVLLGAYKKALEDTDFRFNDNLDVFHKILPPRVDLEENSIDELMGVNFCQRSDKTKLNGKGVVGLESEFSKEPPESWTCDNKPPAMVYSGDNHASKATIVGRLDEERTRRIRKAFNANPPTYKEPLELERELNPSRSPTQDVTDDDIDVHIDDIDDNDEFMVDWDSLLKEYPKFKYDEIVGKFKRKVKKLISKINPFN